MPDARSVAQDIPGLPGPRRVAAAGLAALALLGVLMATGTVPATVVTWWMIALQAVAAGVCAHLRPTDAVTATHRPHHQALAHGVDIRRMAAEIFGKETGLGHGKGGHMHLFSAEPAFGCSGIIGEGIPTAVGHALAFKKQGRDDIAVAFFGEGAANQGSFHESLNLAALWTLPVVFVCEDNAWAISVPKEKSTAIADNSARAAAYGMPGVLIPDNDPVGVYEAAGEAVARARRGGGPCARCCANSPNSHAPTALFSPSCRNALTSRRPRPIPVSNATPCVLTSWMS